MPRHIVEHAYFFDRWWQQRAILLYFKALLPGVDKNNAVTTSATVNQTPFGLPASAQTVDLGAPTRAWADAARSLYLRHEQGAHPAAARPSLRLAAPLRRPCILGRTWDTTSSWWAQARPAACSLLG